MKFQSRGKQKHGCAIDKNEMWVCLVNNALLRGKLLLAKMLSGAKLANC
ncbi:hypothetical protein L0668_11700 [Paraglaciecola aquimarina]|uniref:Transposase n=1 Tax=Paraglaciecola algarum TaxID=3050085 RepID=A0ABS9DAF8_9ALTE|nr:hypothetical protein [Paraglaciecola sp. G1-23]MCF2948774.1 hypothetical protein [Paraglaciecola sp. G1-23]